MGILALLLAILWLATCNRRATLVDHWEVMLAELWSELDFGEIQGHYSEALRRQAARERMQEGISEKTRHYLLSFRDFHQARWVLNLFVPLTLVSLSMWVIVHCFSL